MSDEIKLSFDDNQARGDIPATDHLQVLGDKTLIVDRVHYLSVRMKRHVHWLLLVLCTVPCAGQQESRNQSALHEIVSLLDFDEIPVTWNMKGESQAFFNEGLNSLREGNYFVAVDQLTKALETDPSVTVAYYYRAIALKQPDKDSEEADFLRLGLKENPARLRKAQEDILLFVQANPDLYEARLELGKILHLSGEEKKAAKHFDWAAEERPKDPRGYYFLGLGSLHRGEEGKARKYFDRCVEADPKFTSGLMHLAFLSFIKDKTGRGGEWMVFLNRVLEIDSMQRAARQVRFSLNEKEKPKEALPDIDFLVRYAPLNFKYRMSRAFLLTRLELYDRAFTDIRHILEAANVSENVFLGQQTSIDKLIDINNAGYYLLRKIYGMKEEDAAYIRKAFCQLCFGKEAEVPRTLSSMKDADNNAVALYLRAIALEHTKSFVEAYVDYERTVKLDKTVFDAQKKCAIILSSGGNWEESMPYFNELEKLNPEFVPTYQLRGVAHYNLKDYRKAIADFTTYIQKDTTNKEVYYNRGVCYQELGNMMTAVRDMVKASDYKALNFVALHKEVDRLIQKGDTALLMSFAEAIMKIPSRMGYGIDLEVMKVKLMHLQRDWTFIGDRYRRLVITKRESDDATYISYTLAAQGTYLADQANWKEAASLFDRAIGYDKRNAIAYLERGKMRLKMKETEMALVDLQQAAKLGDQRAEQLRTRLSASR